MTRKAPPFFIGLTLLFWGWQYQLLPVAVCLCLVVESIHFFKFRFSFEPEDFNKFIDVSIVLLAAAVVITLSSESRKAVFIILRWLPVIFFPIVTAQQFSEKGKIDIRAFFLVGKKKKQRPTADVRQIDVSYYYALIVLLSTGMVRPDGYGFYAGISLFFFWGLWQVSPQRISRPAWALCVLGIIFSGFWGHQAVHKISRMARIWMVSYFSGHYEVNPYRNSTALGDIGELKLSDLILYRVKKDSKERPAGIMLLQNATYNIFGTTTWYANSDFKPVDPGKTETFWQIQPPVENAANLMIYSRLERKRAVLTLPAGVVSISQMKVGACEKNGMQTIRVEDGPSFIKAVVNYTGKLSYDPAPYDRDLMIPDKESAGIQKIVSELNLENQSPEQILKTVKHYFLSRFSYSLELKGKGDYDTSVQNFLHHTRAGHCELFATAAALILRQVNMPTRYVTGFIAHEYSSMENCIVIRNRDAHAWVKVYNNGHWENLDVTPPVSLQADMERVKVSAVSDMLSFLRFKLYQFRHETGKRLIEKYSFWLVIPLGLFLFFRLKKSNSIKKAAILSKKSDQPSMKSLHSAFFNMEKLFQEKGYQKHPYETYGTWYDRVKNCFEDPADRQQFSNLIAMYNQWRFSSAGINSQQKIQFDRDIERITTKTKALL